MSFFVKEGGIFYDVTLYFYPISFNRSAKVPGNVLVDIFPNEFLGNSTYRAHMLWWALPAEK